MQEVYGQINSDELGQARAVQTMKPSEEGPGMEAGDYVAIFFIIGLMIFGFFLFRDMINKDVEGRGERIEHYTATCLINNMSYDASSSKCYIVVDNKVTFFKIVDIENKTYLEEVK